MGIASHIIMTIGYRNNSDVPSCNCNSNNIHGWIANNNASKFRRKWWRSHWLAVGSIENVKTHYADQHSEEKFGFIVDSRTTDHLFTMLKVGTLEVISVGEIEVIRTGDQRIIMQNVWCLNNLIHNLLSVSQLDEKRGLTVIFKNNVIILKNNRIYVQGE